MTPFPRNFKLAVLALSLGLAGVAQAGLFDDDEARKAILDLRERLTRSETQAGEQIKRAADDNAQLRKSLIELQNQIDALRGELSQLRGQDERMARDLADLQRRQKDISQGVEERLRKFEPTKVSVDGREFLADPAEKKDYEAAVALFRQGEFAAAQTALLEFFRRYPQSGYTFPALYWLGNTLYAQRDYKGAIAQFRAFLQQAPDHMRAPEAMLSMANCQLESKDVKGGRKTLEDLMKAFPGTEAATAAKERLARLR